MKQVKRKLPKTISVAIEMVERAGSSGLSSKQIAEMLKIKETGLRIDMAKFAVSHRYVVREIKNNMHVYYPPPIWVKKGEVEKKEFWENEWKVVKFKKSGKVGLMEHVDFYHYIYKFAPDWFVLHLRNKWKRLYKTKFPEWIAQYNHETRKPKTKKTPATKAEPHKQKNLFEKRLILIDSKTTGFRVVKENVSSTDACLRLIDLARIYVQDEGGTA